MPEIGNSLREARIRRGLSIRDVSDVTKIRAKYLEALEDDDFEVLPGPTFVKAFLRTYATLLKLDADALIDDYRRRHDPADQEARDSVPEVSLGPRARPNSPGSPEERSSVGTGYADTRRSRTVTESKKRRVRRGQRGYALVGIVAVVVVVLLAWFGSGRGRDAASIDASSISGSGTSLTAVGEGTIVTGAAGSPSNPASGSGTTSSTAAGGGTATAVTSAGDVTLVVTVTEGSCWLVVREDSESGAEIYAGTLSAGGEQTFDSSKRYWMLVGKPEVLSLSVNGVTYSLTAPAGSFLVTGAGVERSE